MMCCCEHVIALVAYTQFFQVTLQLPPRGVDTTLQAKEDVHGSCTVTFVMCLPFNPHYGMAYNVLPSTALYMPYSDI
jgi:hypothetical protein